MNQDKEKLLEKLKLLSDFGSKKRDWQVNVIKKIKQDEKQNYEPLSSYKPIY